MLLVRHHTPMFRFCCTRSVRTISGNPVTSMGVTQTASRYPKAETVAKSRNWGCSHGSKTDGSGCMASLRLTSSLSKRQLFRIYSVFPPLGPWRYARDNVLSIICRCPKLRVALLFTYCCGTRVNATIEEHVRC